MLLDNDIMKELTPSQRIDEEASLWASRIEGGDLSLHERTALSAWLNTRPEHQQKLANYRDLSARIDAHIAVQLGAAVEAVVREQKTKRKRRHIFTSTLAAAAAIAVVLFATSGHSQNFTTNTAERHVAILEDGTQIDLNARTTLYVDFTRDERRVRFVGGEALFTVAKDAKRPFVVATPSGSVRVTGTVFNVRTANTERVEVTVLEGTVRVRPPGDSTDERPVTAGLRAVLSNSDVTVRTLPDGAALDAAAWRQGQVVFDDTPLGEAIERFAAYHARMIVVDHKVADLRLGGRYSLEDLNGLLDAIESALPVRVSRGPGNAVRISSAERHAK
jgi:transmembrane sensor